MSMISEHICIIVQPKWKQFLRIISKGKKQEEQLDLHIEVLCPICGQQEPR